MTFAMTCNRLISIDALCSTLQHAACCKQCTDMSQHTMMTQFLSFCNEERQKTLAQLPLLAVTEHIDAILTSFDVPRLHKKWCESTTELTTRSMSSVPLTVTEETYGLATSLEFICNRCTQFGSCDSRGWKNHSTKMQAKKQSTTTSK